VSKQKVLTRKGKALRRIARFLVVMLVVNWVFGIGLLTPRHAIWEQQEREGITGFMRTVERDWVPEIGWTHFRYLMQNEKAVMLAGTNLEFFGWMGAFSTALDCTTGEPLYIGMDSLHKDENSVYYFYGRVDDPEIAYIDISLCHQEYHDGQYSYPEDFRLYVPEDWLEQDGHRFFMLRSLIDWPHKTRIHPFAIALNEAGEELYRFEIGVGASSHFG